jgi:hypothetical protein
MLASVRTILRSRPSRTTWIAVLLATALGTSIGVVMAAPAGASAASSAPGAPTLAGSGVNPYSAYSAEPAPVGITDFGLGPGDLPYEYNTTAWLDTADFQTLNVNATGPGEQQLFFPADGLGVTLQQNVVLAFEQGGQTYYYWIQNVAGITPGGCPPDTSLIFADDQWEVLVGSCPSNPTGPNHDTTSYVYFVNDIWNFSASGPEGAPLYGCTGVPGTPCSVEGNGTVYGNLVYAAAAEDLPGNQVNLTFPSAIELKVASFSKGGSPAIAFEYDDGFAWQTYDTAIFPFAANATEVAFQVNGYTQNPDGHFTDAELDLGGFGDGTYSALNDTQASLSEVYWNGHNWETPANAFNFGGDTAESVDYASSTADFQHPSGTIELRVINASTTKLDQAYDRSQDALVVVTVPAAAAGAVQWGGKRYPFTGGEYTQIFAPGKYMVRVHVGHHDLFKQRVPLTAGGTTTISA